MHSLCTLPGVLHNFSLVNKHECFPVSREEFMYTLCTSFSRLKMLLGFLLLSSQKSLSSAFCFFCWNQREPRLEGRSACVSLAPSLGGFRALSPLSECSLFSCCPPFPPPSVYLSLPLLLSLLPLPLISITLSAIGQ